MIAGWGGTAEFVVDVQAIEGHLGGRGLLVGHGSLGLLVARCPWAFGGRRLKQAAQLAMVCIIGG
jgi:hypothetical protein